MGNPWLEGTHGCTCGSTQLPTMRVQYFVDTRLGEIRMTVPAMAQQLALKNIVRIINFECI